MVTTQGLGDHSFLCRSCTGEIRVLSRCHTGTAANHRWSPPTAMPGARPGSVLEAPLAAPGCCSPGSPLQQRPPSRKPLWLKRPWEGRGCPLFFAVKDQGRVQQGAERLPPQCGEGVTPFDQPFQGHATANGTIHPGTRLTPVRFVLTHLFTPAPARPRSSWFLLVLAPGARL